MKKQLYIIGGPMGVGKTAVCQALKEKLPNSVFLDGDWCWDMNPFQVTPETKTMVLDNICYLLNNSINCSAFEHVIFGWVLHEQQTIDTILERIPAHECNTKVISLVCDETSLKQRLQKDIESNSREENIIDRGLSYLPLYDSLDSIKIDTSDMAIDDVAQQIMKL